MSLSRTHKRTGSSGMASLILAFIVVALGASVLTLTTRRVESKSDSASAQAKFKVKALRADRMKRPAARESSAALSPPVFVPITVDRTDDSASPLASLCSPAPNDCSLRGATKFANAIPGTIINLPAGTYQLTSDGSAEVGFCLDENVGDLNIAGNNTSIVGAGAATTIIQQTTPNDRVICVDANLAGNFNFSISGVTITGGRETNGVGGGGIISGAFGNTTTVTDCVFSNNQVSGAGSPVGAGIGNGAGSLIISGTTFSNNTSAASGGGVYTDTLGSGTLSVTNSTFTNNTATNGNGGGLLAAATFGGGPFSVTSSSFSGNNSGGAGTSGGGLFKQSGSMSVTLSSFSDNHATGANSRGGGIANGNGLMTANYNRIVGNTAAGGSGVANLTGTTDSNDNWWGCSSGPSGATGAGCAVSPNGTFGTTAASWLQLRHSAADPSLCANEATTLTADIKGRNAGAALTTELNGLVAFPSPPATIFGNASLGTLSGASTQFVNGVATATFTAGVASGTGGADATADNQTASASISVQNTTTTDPADQTVCQGTDATFSTTASGGSSITYAWTLDGSPFGGNTSSITIPTGSLSVGAHTVTVTASSDCGSDTETATLTVQAGTTTTDPADVSTCEGQTVNFSTTASGTGPFSFVWKQGATVLVNGSLGGRVTISSSATTSTLTIANVQPGDAGTYNVETTGACNTATQSATLAVGAGAPTITLKNVNISLWPPNHRYQTVTVADLVESAADACDAGVNLNSVKILQVTSDELDDNPSGADGNTTNDIVIAANCKSVQLRSERDANLNGRVYKITFIVTDVFGRSTTATANVTVPVSQNGSPAGDSGVHYTVNGNCP